jgi:peptidoglycan-associated lipoprotein
MNMKKTLLPLLLAAMLSACAASQTKEAPKAAAPAASLPVIEAVEVTAPAAETSVAGNPLTDPANILSKRAVYFDFDKFEIKPEYSEMAAAHANYLVMHPETTIRIEGNADDRGSREYNLSLGQKRAVAVKKAINVLGVPDKQIETISFGEEKPKATGENEASWSENRRADIVYAGE